MRSNINIALAITLAIVGIVGARYIAENYGASGRWLLIVPVALFYVVWWLNRRRQE